MLYKESHREQKSFNKKCGFSRGSFVTWYFTGFMLQWYNFIKVIKLHLRRFKEVNKVYGYVRVSTGEQNTARQYEALKDYEVKNGIKFNKIFEDKKSGKNFDRTDYQLMKEVIKKGDTLVVKELDRLGRNYEEIKKELQELKDKGVKVAILDLPMLQGINDELLYAVLQDMIIGIMGYVAQKEREKIQTRVKEGLERAKAEGKELGRPKMKLPASFDKYYRQWKDNKINQDEFAKLLEVSRMTVYRYIKFYEASC